MTGPFHPDQQQGMAAERVSRRRRAAEAALQVPPRRPWFSTIFHR